MTWQVLLSSFSLLVALVTLASYYDGKIKDAKERGKIEQKVSYMEEQQLKNEATRQDMNALLLAIGKMTGQIETLQKAVDELKDDMKCIERRKTP
jgi:peptidoglycan hydrolase CwlO-like protein